MHNIVLEYDQSEFYYWKIEFNGAQGKASYSQLLDFDLVFEASNSIHPGSKRHPNCKSNHVATYQFEEVDFETHCRLGNYKLHAMWK